MNLRDLEYVVALAEAAHFGRAAAKCRVTQPTLSMQLAHLESELGVQLFERQPRRVLPTPQGRAVAAQAVVVLAEVRRLREVAKAPRDILAGPLRFGLIPTVGPYLLPHLLSLLKERHPALRLLVQEGTTAALLSELAGDALDAAVLSLPIDEREVDHEPFLTEPFVVALRPDHPLAARDQLAPGDLRHEEWLLLEDGHCMRDQVQEICARARGKGFQAGSVESLRQMVSAGMGCTLLPYLATVGCFKDAASLAYRPLRARKPPARTLVIAWRRRSYAAMRLRSLAAEIRQHLAPLCGSFHVPAERKSVGRSRRSR